MRTLAFLTRQSRIARIVQTALGVILGDLLTRPVEAAAAFHADPDAALRLALEQAFRVTGVKLDAREAAQAIGKLALVAQFDKLGEAARGMVADQGRLREKHGWLK